NLMDGHTEIPYLLKIIEAFHGESQLTMQGLRAILNRIADALIPPRAQSDAQPSVAAVRHNPNFYKAPSDDGKSQATTSIMRKP
ncbi:hypothetical protein PJP12_29940, partial [Mycobacterium kansasii]